RKFNDGDRREERRVFEEEDGLIAECRQGMHQHLRRNDPTEAAPPRKAETHHRIMLNSVDRLVGAAEDLADVSTVLQDKGEAAADRSRPDEADERKPEID